MRKYIVLIIFTCNISVVFAGTLLERIYVQTDKQMYLAGEPVLMKFFTTNSEHIPIVYSKIAYAELVSNGVAILQIKVELTDGTGMGRMLLPADLSTGYYRLIAYTQYMRNEGAGVFFEKNIAVLNTFQSGYQPGKMEEKGEIGEIGKLGEMGEMGEMGKSEPGTISLQPDKATYTKRAHGELILDGLPKNIHTLSVSIAGKECIPVTESDLSLFQKNLTKKSAGFTDDFLPEYEGHIVTGKFMDNQTGNLVAVKDIASLSAGLSFPTGDGIRFFSGQKTETGDVRFCTSGISETQEIATVVFRANDRYRVDIQTPFVSIYEPQTLPAFQVDAAHYDQLLDRSVALQLFRYFSDDPAEIQTMQEPHFKMKPTNSYPLDEYTRFTTMREIFVEFIRGARFRSNAGKQELSVLSKRSDILEYGNNSLVLLDGVPITDHEIIYQYDPLTVEKINIYNGPCIFGSLMFDGVIELITYRRLHADLNLNRSTQVITYEGPQLPYRLNIPDYSKVENIQNKMPDGRHTLLWNPDVKTGGKTSIRLPFNTSDLSGDFQATIQGITKEGKFIFATMWFHVE